MSDRFATDWASLQPPPKPEVPWTALMLAGLGGGLLAAAALVALSSWLHFSYTPYDGVAAKPALFDYPSVQEVFYYLAGLLIAFIFGGISMAWTRASREPL